MTIQHRYPLVVNGLVPLLLTATLAYIFFPVAQKYSQSFKFVDEQEHLIMAWLMDQGYRLYTDFPNNHQPISYYLSYLTQHFFVVNNVFMLVKRHREVVFAWGVVWWYILIKRFGPKMLIPIFIYENLKYFTLGNQFLAESFIVYPLTYLLADLLTTNVSRLSSWSHYRTGLLTAFIQFTLLPMAIPLLLLTLAKYIRHQWQGISNFLAGTITVVILVFSQINPSDYVREVFNALKYSLPGLSPVDSPWQLWRLLGLPLFYLSHFRDIIGIGVIFALLWWITALIIFIFRRHPSQFWLTTLGLFIWLSTNTRVAHANEYYYQAFHLTPWLLVGFTGGTLSLWSAAKLTPTKIRLLLILLNLAGVITILTYPNLPLYTHVDPLTEHYVQYTPITQAAERINSLKQPGDRLMVIPNDSLIYYMTSLLPADTNMFTFYDWQVQVPKNRRLFFRTLNTQPPAFIVYHDDGSSYSPFMNEYLKRHYLNLTQYPHVYLLKDYQDRLETSNDSTP